MNAPVLLADVGATHTRLALYSRGCGIGDPLKVRNVDYDSLENVVVAYLSRCSAKDKPRLAAFAVAGPVQDEEVTITNLGWHLSVPAFKQRIGFDAVHVMNDFCAVALSVPALKPNEVVAIGQGAPEQGGAIGVLGPGTGLGVAGLVQAGTSWIPIAGEGGHVTLAPRNDRELALLQMLQLRFDHVSAERVLSGPGIRNLYSILAQQQGRTDPAPAASEISARALSGSDAIAEQALDVFFLMLGTVAGNLALTLGASGGIYLAGGILPELRDRLLSSGFRKRFTDKGRYRAYLEAIPTYLITADTPALIGLARFIDQDHNNPGAWHYA